MWLLDRREKRNSPPPPKTNPPWWFGPAERLAQQAISLCIPNPGVFLLEDERKKKKKKDCCLELWPYVLTRVTKPTGISPEGPSLVSLGLAVRLGGALPWGRPLQAGWEWDVFRAPPRGFPPLPSSCQPDPHARAHNPNLAMRTGTQCPLQGEFPAAAGKSYQGCTTPSPDPRCSLPLLRAFHWEAPATTCRRTSSVAAHALQSPQCLSVPLRDCARRGRAAAPPRGT